ncbi:hypothetical protein [Mesorhizobium sp. B1-1-5]|uniref:hypothetical protein n=1 Tax=Mesorhizobium sp. B1-1-5 TaxID=2589979 RepID=UPI00112CA64E|nr:hypothetical protein [Mesorhizobium sp. B1-1-5]TPO07131.1 hypothetical protein FJ980_12470 [Mesorhizobium sp. B1-1-5]
MRKWLFDDKAHVIIASILDDASEHLINSGICKPQEVDEYIALDYIAQCSAAITHGVVYLEHDEMIGAGIFLDRYSRKNNRQLFQRNSDRCVSQLVRSPNIYFPDYLALLRFAYLRVLNSVSDADILRASGVLMLAAATLPGVRTDIRRELRRRGLSYDPSLISEDTLQKRIGPNGSVTIAHRLAGPKSQLIR